MRRMVDWRPLERVQAVFSPTAALRRGTALMAAGKPGPAFQLYVRASRGGLAEAEYRVGRCYLDGAAHFHAGIVDGFAVLGRQNFQARP